MIDFLHQKSETIHAHFKYLYKFIVTFSEMNNYTCI